MKRKASDEPSTKRPKPSFSQRKHPKTEQELAIGGETTWKRPDLVGQDNIIDPARKSFCFMNIDCDYYTGYPPSTTGKYVSKEDWVSGQEPILRLFGVTKEGHSCLVNVVGFIPYFYIDCWPNFHEREIADLQKALEAALAQKHRGKYKKFIRKITLVEKRSLWSYSDPNKSFHFLKIETMQPKFVGDCRRIIDDRFHIPGVGVFGKHVQQQLRTYESATVFPLRFMIDLDIRGAGWVELPKGTYEVIPKPNSHCQIELKTRSEFIQSRNSKEWMDIAPIRILSFDIECQSLTGGFPDAETNDPVIQISNVVKVQGESSEVVKNVFCLKETAPLTDAEVIWFHTEKELLKAWAEFVRKVDPDIITGYNIMNFDVPYILTRCRKLKMETDGAAFSRLKNVKVTARKREFNSAQAGTYDFHDITCAGRVVLDLLPLIRTGYKLRSYSLNAVASHFLKQQKDDVHYSIMSSLQNGSSADRRRLAKYCLKDSLLVMNLLDKLMLVINNIEMARVTGVPLGYLATRGQGIKVLSQLYRKARQQDIIIPIIPRGSTDMTFQGATVLEPTTGFYDEPITTLDFASLYPSIMMAHNLCYTSWFDIRKKEAFGLTDDDYTQTPTGDCFVKAHKRKGLLPEILHELLAARKVAKKDMKAAKDPFKKAVFNGRQLALKISANSVYGFTGAANGALPCTAISSSVTSFGRQMIEQSKAHIEAHYTVANGFDHDADVIYGDTDSVMIKFGYKDIGKSIELGEEAAKLVTSIFVKPIKLEFEKVYKPYLLMSKKRYAGMLWTKPEKWDYMDMKGIETRRRDNCLWVGNCLQKALDHLLIDSSIDLARKHINSEISRLMANKVDLSELILSKALKKIDSYTNVQAHVEVAKKMMKRDPGSAPVSGDRVAFVYVKKEKKAKGYEKAEDPLYVLEHDLPIDTAHYIGTQLQKPLTRLFEPIMGDKVGTLFNGEHTFKVKKTFRGKQKKGGKFNMMAAFVKVVAKCMRCGNRLKGKEKTVCKRCEPFGAQIYLQKIQALKARQKRFGDLWTQCQRCQGSLCQEVLCSNNSCPIYYRRVRARKDLQVIQEELSKFTL